MPELRCRYRLPSPGHAGAVDMDTLKRWAAQFPHLRPCPKVHWDWIDRKRCERCEFRLEAIEKPPEQGTPTANNEPAHRVRLWSDEIMTELQKLSSGLGGQP